MHIHGLLFQILSRNGNTKLSPSDRGWKDTVLVYPSETVRLLVKFTDYTGIYLLHCHNLEHEDDGMMMNFRVNNTTGVGSQKPEIPSGFRLHQNYPNPFNPSTKISFEIPVTSDVRLEVFNIQGRGVATLVKETVSAGRHTVEFTAIDAQRASLSSGTYFARLTVGEVVQTVAMVLMR
jgi:hypothetical protein